MVAFEKTSMARSHGVCFHAAFECLGGERPLCFFSRMALWDAVACDWVQPSMAFNISPWRRCADFALQAPRLGFCRVSAL